MSKKKKSIIGIAFIIVALAYAVLTAGVVVYNYRTFGVQNDIVLVEGLESDIYIHSGFNQTGIIFIGHYFRTNELPYSLRVQIWDKEKKYSSINVNKITVTYSNGRISEKTMHWDRALTAYKLSHYSREDGSTYEDIKMLSDHIPDVVDEYTDCTVKIEGFLTTVSGEKILFSPDAVKFEYRERSGVSTYMEYIAGV